MAKNWHEIRDPIHVFVRLDSQERAVLDSPPFQRLRHIHQLGMSHLVYPGANHTRFEHSLGVMELASNVYDVATTDLAESVREAIPEAANEDRRRWWRRVLRMAALCHDLGHLPFSHAAEKELLPQGWDHERLTMAIINSPEMRGILESSQPPLTCEKVVKLAVGPEKYRGEPFTVWESILAEIIVGNAFGVDRMDYLLRDSHHTGVPYGRFDHSRLIDTLRIMPSFSDSTGDGSEEPMLGIEEGGLHCAEALLLARYFMYAQVYFHPVRRIYDIHLKEFLKSWLSEGYFPTECEEHLVWTDNEVTSGLRECVLDPGNDSHVLARRIMCREHFKRIYHPSPDDREKAQDAGARIADALSKEFGKEHVRHDHYDPSGGLPDFPVLERDGRIASSMAISKVIPEVPKASVDYVFVSPEREKEGLRWVDANRDTILMGKEGS